VREVYAALLSANVGVKNVEHIVRTVLNKLGGVKVGRLPRKIKFVVLPCFIMFTLWL
jgi:signal recognition particle GTPase